MSNLHLPRWTGRVIVALIAIAALLIIFRLGSQASAGVALNDPVVWVEDGRNGRLLQINGSTREITAQVEVGEDGDSLVALPQGRDAVFLNRTTGVVGVVGAVSLAVDEENTEPGDAGVVGDQLELLANHADEEWTDGYIIDTDRILVVEPGRPQSLSIPIPAGQGLGDTVVNAEGRLLAVTGDAAQVTISTDNGLESLVALPPLIDQSASAPGLVRAGDSIYLVDSRRRVINEVFDGELGPDSAVCGSPNEVQITGNVLTASDGAHRILVHDSNEGTLSVTEPAASNCVVIELDETGENWGAPVAVDSTAYLPNFDTGEIVVVDLEDRVVTDNFRFRPATGQAFELEVFNGTVWANEPDGFRAAVVTGNELEPISKLGDVFIGGVPADGADGAATLVGGTDDEGPRVFDEDGAIFGVTGGEGDALDGFGLPGGRQVEPNEQPDQESLEEPDPAPEGAVEPATDPEPPPIAADEPLEPAQPVDQIVPPEPVADPEPDAPIVEEQVSDEPTTTEDILEPVDVPVDLPDDLPDEPIVVPIEGAEEQVVSRRHR